MAESQVAERQLLILTENLYTLINSMEKVPAGLHTSVEMIKERCHELTEQIQQFRDTIITRWSNLQGELEQLSNQLKSQYENWTADNSERWDEFRKNLADSYENFLNSIRSDKRISGLRSKLRSIRPRNYFRNIFHVMNGAVGIVLYEWVLDRTACLIALGSILAVYFSLDISRRIWPRLNELMIEKWFRHIVRPRERYTIPGATYYAIALFLVVLMAEQTVAQIAVLVLCIGDPVAALVGRRWGERKIRGSKSWAGSIGFFLASFVGVVGFMVWLRPTALPIVLAMAAVAALVGALTEMFATERIDDNLTVPLAVALALMLIF